ncbi:MAG: TonB-dependent receptor [Tannerella sp.]|jgi:TonB-linked SusC/RagA family outer membrane protein|nr:TonB-dependent receptor [Tannerella sp.]
MKKEKIFQNKEGGTWLKKLSMLCLLACFSLTVSAQKRVTGTVLDTSGETVIGANVVEKGTTNGTSTDSDGKFVLTVGDNAVLQISYVGYVTQEIKVGNQTALNITLQEDAQALEEVVVVGYGVQKKVTLIGSVATVSSKDIQAIPATNLTAALSGRLAGVKILQSTGTPGSTSSLTVRATGTWNNADPLYVIDGVVRDKVAFDGLNASEIENLSVLKDASAAIYGARAANGVVLVTTKRGTSGKPVISYSGHFGVSEPTKFPSPQTAYDQAVFINDYLTEQKITDMNNGSWYTQDELDFFKTHDFPWLDPVLKSPTVNKHALNVSGGNDRVRYFVGGNFQYETGIFDNSNYRTYNLRGNIEASITKDLIASLNLNMDNRFTQVPQWRYNGDNITQYDLFKALLIHSSMTPPYINGLPVGKPYVEWHPLELIKGVNGYDRRKNNYYEATVALQYNIPWIEGLSLKVQYNKYDSYAFRKQLRLPYNMYNFETTGGHGHIVDPATAKVVDVYIRNDGNALIERQQMDYNYQLNGYITYNHRFGKHDIGALFVYEQAEGTSDWFQAERDNYISADIDQLDAGSSTPAILPTGSGSENGRLSYIGRINYGYDNKYLFEASFRYDGSVRFAPKKRWGFFPSAFAAWRISEENFFKENINFINSLKLRASVGVLGNDAVGGWQWAQRYNFTSGQYYGGSGVSTGVSAAAIPNPDITWEKSASWNGGLDATFLNSKLVVGADVFYRHTYDILGSRLAALPTTFGASMPQENYATIDTKGFELEMSYNNKYNDIEYYVKGNLGYAVNKLIYQDEAENIRPYQSKIGLNTDIAMGYVATDIIRTQAELDAIMAANPNYRIFGNIPTVGMLNYKDLRGPNSETPDGIIDSNDQTWIRKHTTPPVNYGFGLGGIWKNITLDLYFQGVGNYDVMPSYRGTQARQIETNFDIWTDHWTPENPNASMPKTYNNQAGNESTFWLKNGAYLRLKNVTLAYDLPKSVINKLNMGQCRIFVEGQNLLLLIDHVKWFDPEVGNTGNNMLVYPITKTYSVGINISL